MKAQIKNQPNCLKGGKTAATESGASFLDQSEKLRKYKAIPDDFDFLFRTNTVIN